MAKTALVVSILFASFGLCRADTASVRAKLQAALVEQDETRLSIPGFAESAAEGIKAATREDIHLLLPLAHKCLQSHLKTVKEYGLIVFFLTTFRPDSSDLLAPFVDSDLAPVLDIPDLSVKREVIFILGHSNPIPSPKALDHLSAHLADKNNTEREAGGIVGALLAARSSDAKTVRYVLDFVQRRPDLRLKTGVIQLLGAYHASTDEAIKLIRDGLSDKNEDIRKIAVEAVGRMPRDTRAKFSSDLLRVLANPNETKAVRALAEAVVHH